jgi:predicted anti-sigma-YlaC factor YlaD
MTTTSGTIPARIDCETAARALYDYLDGRLAGATYESVTAHIETCRNCSSHYIFARQLLDQIPASLPLSTESQALHARIVASLKAEGYTESSSR